jgi:hypothetical protein
MLLEQRNWFAADLDECERVARVCIHACDPLNAIFASPYPFRNRDRPVATSIPQAPRPPARNARSAPPPALGSCVTFIYLEQNPDEESGNGRAYSSGYRSHR